MSVLPQSFHRDRKAISRRSVCRIPDQGEPPSLNTRSALAIGIVCLPLLFVRPSFANDAAAGIAAGGIQLRKEINVSLEKENLYISRDKVTVSYIFKNNSRNAI